MPGGYHHAIRKVLLREWDPIGVVDEPEAQDEYDAYIHEIHGMLIRHETRHKLIDHLWWIETEHMGLFGNLTRTRCRRSAHRNARRDRVRRVNPSCAQFCPTMRCIVRNQGGAYLGDQHCAKR